MSDFDYRADNPETALQAAQQVLHEAEPSTEAQEMAAQVRDLPPGASEEQVADAIFRAGWGKRQAARFAPAFVALEGDR